MTNQTIDGVPRDDLELVLLHGHSTHESDQAWDRLRALLEAPAKPAEGLEADNVKLAADRTALSAELETLRKSYRSVLAQLEAAQPQGEPVAVMYADGSVLTKAECGIAFEVCCKVETPLYAEQPAPVAVVLPERLLGDDGVCTESHYASGWNACLYEAARLTATVRIPERLVMTDGLHTYEYVTGHNAAIDKMLGVQS